MLWRLPVACRAVAHRRKATGIGHLCSSTPLQQDFDGAQLIALAGQVQGRIAIPAGAIRDL